MSDSTVLGKLLPNLKVTFGDEKSNSESVEEGEISDTETRTPAGELTKSEIIRKWMQTLHTPKVYPNKLGGFETGLDLSSEVLIKKLEERAERFGLGKGERRQITQLEIDDLYKSLGLDSKNLKSSCKNIRLGVIHMRGVSEMNTHQVLGYFKDYGPSTVEWINDVSCNVCWYDQTSAARALLGMSQPVIVKRKNKSRSAVTGNSECWASNTEAMEKETIIEMSDSEEDETVEAKGSSDGKAKGFDVQETETCDEDETKETFVDSAMDIDEKTNKSDSLEDAKNLHLDVPVPPGHWRLGVPHPKAKAILLRFATKDDKKLPGAEKRSQYYQKYGNPNYGGLKGLISGSRKRRFQAVRTREVVEKLSSDKETTSKEVSPASSFLQASDYQKRSKVPRMKMYADEEEEKIKRGSHHQGESKKPKSIKSRLGSKYTKEDLHQVGKKFCSEDEEPAEETLSVTCKIPSRFNIWNDQAKAMAEEDNIPNHRQSERYCAYSSERSSYEKQYRYNQYSGDLRDALNNSSHKRHAVKGDLRSKIEMLKEDDKPRKHRSPLCVDSD